MVALMVCAPPAAVARAALTRDPPGMIPVWILSTGMDPTAVRISYFARPQGVSAAPW